MNVTSLTDQKTIERLQYSRQALLASGEKGGIMDIIRRELGTITRNVYVLRSVPEQGEDCYDVLIDGTTVAHIEIPREGVEGDVVFESVTLQEYRKRCGRMSRKELRKLELARQLAGQQRPG